MTDKPERYPNLHAVPTKLLASNIVGSIIGCKGNINMWGALMEDFITKYREEEAEREQRIDAALAQHTKGMFSGVETCKRCITDDQGPVVWPCPTYMALRGEVK